MRLLGDLEPYRLLSNDEVVGLMDKGLATPVEVRVKLRFADYIRRFERENINILQFGENLPYDRRIEAISAELARYAADEIGNNINQSISSDE